MSNEERASKWVSEGPPGLDGQAGLLDGTAKAKGGTDSARAAHLRKLRQGGPWQAGRANNVLFVVVVARARARARCMHAINTDLCCAHALTDLCNQHSLFGAVDGDADCGGASRSQQWVDGFDASFQVLRVCDTRTPHTHTYIYIHT